MNREIFPASAYPLAGDVESQAGNTQVTVTGIQNTPVMNQEPDPGQILIYDLATGKYVPGDPIVSGPDAPGSPSTRNPVQIGGVDNAGNVHAAVVSEQGNQSVYSSSLEELIGRVLLELRAIRTAIIALDNTLNPADFDATSFPDELTSEGSVR